VIFSSAPTSCTAATCCSDACIRASTDRLARRRSTGSRCSIALKDHASADTIFVFGHGAENNVKGAKADVVFFRDYSRRRWTTCAKDGRRRSRRTDIKVASLKGFEA
jgi:hypothetical protein